MKLKRYSSEQIIRILNQADAGAKKLISVINTGFLNKRSITGAPNMAA